MRVDEGDVPWPVNALVAKICHSRSFRSVRPKPSEICAAVSAPLRSCLLAMTSSSDFSSAWERAEWSGINTHSGARFGKRETYFCPKHLPQLLLDEVQSSLVGRVDDEDHAACRGEILRPGLTQGGLSSWMIAKN
jgi:hypothetical protein